jgi:Family of unknown function (DUF6496)
MAKPKSKTDKIVARQMKEVFDDPPSTVKPGQSAEATRKQKVAIGLSKAREAGADIPKAPAKPRKSSKASY